MTGQLALAVACAPSAPEPLLRFTYRGKPAVKKNSQEIITRGPDERPLLVPGADFRRAQRGAVPQIQAFLSYRPAMPTGATALGTKKRPVRVQAHFYLGKRQNPDLDGLISGCADILEAAGVVANDYWIVSWDGSRRFRDPDDPRTEVSVWEEAR